MEFSLSALLQLVVCTIYTYRRESRYKWQRDSIHPLCCRNSPTRNKMFNQRPTSLGLGPNQTGSDLMSILTPIITSPMINSPEYMKYLFCNNYYPSPQQQQQQFQQHQQQNQQQQPQVQPQPQQAPQEPQQQQQQQPQSENRQQSQPNQLKKQLTEEERLRNKRERNRRAAANCRRRKDEKLRQLEKENSELRETISKLQSALAARAT